MSEGNVLITGGAGFIGRALVGRCLQAGHRVTVVDNLCAGRVRNLEPFLDKIDFCEADILDEMRVRELMASARPDMVFHLAAHHFIPFCNAHPRETLRVNVEGTYAVLSEAARQGVRVAVVASTGALYPSRDDRLGEGVEAAPADVYGLSKHMAEQIARYIAATTNMASVAARLFNTYGPHETNPHLIPHIMESVKRGPSVELGNIHTKRDYIYVDDVAELLYRCARNCTAKHAVVNLGTGVEYSAEEIVNIVGRLLHIDLEINVNASIVRAVDKLHQRADTDRCEALTGTHPRYSLIEGLRRLLVHEDLISEAGESTNAIRLEEGRSDLFPGRPDTSGGP
jgi:UDP-glucose 4-epimerase